MLPSTARQRHGDSSSLARARVTSRTSEAEQSRHNAVPGTGFLISELFVELGGPGGVG